MYHWYRYAFVVEVYRYATSSRIHTCNIFVVLIHPSVFIVPLSFGLSVRLFVCSPVRLFLCSSVCLFPCSCRYLTSLFWAVVVTTGIGWDIIPVTTIEILFTTAMVVFGLILYAVIVGSATVKIFYDIQCTNWK